MNTVRILNTGRLAKAKWAFTTRRVDRTRVRTLLSDVGTKPSAGDLVLARVVSIGQHSTIELPTGRKAAIHPEDEIVVSYGNRYAPDQFEALVPDDLGAAHLVAGGGVAGRAQCQHERMREPTAIEPIGLLGGDDGLPLNLKMFAMTPARPRAIPAIAVFGTSMNAGKTTTVASIIRGLSRAGLRAGAVKVSGTGAGNDLWSMRDAGAIAAYDFTDVGFATTYLSPVTAIVEGAFRLVTALVNDAADVAVIEVADGLFQEETAAIAAHSGFRAIVSACVFAAGDSVGAVAGTARLADLGYTLAAISGLVTRSPLGMREAATAGLPVLTAMELADPVVADRTFAPYIRAEHFLMAGAG